MSTFEIVHSVAQGKGQWMDFKVDKSIPEDAFGHYAFEVTTDGEEDSDTIHVPAHWHRLHDEYITVLEGSLRLTLEGKEIVVRAGDEPFFVPRLKWHSMDSFKGVRTVVREMPSTKAREKALFFKDLLYEGKFPGFWRFMRACYDGDGYPSLPGNVKPFERLFVTVFGLIAKLFVPARPSSLGIN